MYRYDAVGESIVVIDQRIFFYKVTLQGTLKHLGVKLHEVDVSTWL